MTVTLRTQIEIHINHYKAIPSQAAAAACRREQPSKIVNRPNVFGNSRIHPPRKWFHCRTESLFLRSCTLRFAEAGLNTSSWLFCPLPSRFKQCRKRTDHSPNKFSGLRLARQEGRHAVSNVFYSSNWPIRLLKLERERHFSERFPRGLLGLFWPHTWPLGPLGRLDLQLRKTIVFYGSNWASGLQNSSGSATFQTGSRCQCCFRARGGSIEQSRTLIRIRIRKVSSVPLTSQPLGSIS